MNTQGRCPSWAGKPSQGTQPCGRPGTARNVSPTPNAKTTHPRARAPALTLVFQPRGRVGGLLGSPASPPGARGGGCRAARELVPHPRREDGLRPGRDPGASGRRRDGQPARAAGRAGGRLRARAGPLLEPAVCSAARGSFPCEAPDIRAPFVAKRSLQAGRGGSPGSWESSFRRERGVPGSAFRAPGASRGAGREPAQTRRPRGVACRRASGPRHRKKRLRRGWGGARAAPGPRRRAQWCGRCLLLPRGRARRGWESLWTCQSSRRAPPPGAAVRAGGRAPGGRRGALGWVARAGDAARGRASVTPRAGTRRRGAAVW